MALDTRKKGVPKADEVVPYRCYACSRYDGTFGPQQDEHTHVCETCKELPTELVVPEHHITEYMKDRKTYGEEMLGCEDCGRERDECTCDNNRVMTEDMEVRREEAMLAARESVERNPWTVNMTYNVVATRLPEQQTNPNTDVVEDDLALDLFDEE